MQRMTLTEQLTDYIQAAFSGLWVQTSEADEAEREILRLAHDQGWKAAAWDVAHGLRLPGATGEGPSPESAAGDPLAALRALPALAEADGTGDGAALLLLHNLHRFLNSP